uniref:Uncharacterized protein n=1 Tax=Zea mays TaxID=4577 RepID=C0PN52_MAIZE|nr:unknown [Zea mays]
MPSMVRTAGQVPRARSSSQLHQRTEIRPSGACRVVSRATVVEVGSPASAGGVLAVVVVVVVVVGLAYVVAGGVLGQRLDGVERHLGQAVVGVHRLQVAEVAGAAEALGGEAARAHLRGGVRPAGPGVHHLAAPLHHGGVVRQVREQLRRPVPHQLVPVAEPPVAQLRVLPHQQRHVVLRAAGRRHRRDGRADGDAGARLHEPRAQRVVATSSLVRVACPVREEPRPAVPVQLRADLPSCLDAVEVGAVEGAGEDPELGEAEAVGLLDGRIPHVDGGLGAVHRLLRRRRVRDRVLVPVAGDDVRRVGRARGGGGRGLHLP